MIDTETLRKKVIDLAVQGKLTEQLSSDGDAEVLYEQIQEEKERLIKEGEIKKGKNLSEISKDEIPFEIPITWKWYRLGDVYNVLMGQSPNGNNVGTEVEGMEFHQGKIYFGDKFLNKSEQKTSELTRVADENSVLLCVRAPVGVVNISKRKICIGRGLCAINAFASMEPYYLFYYLLSCRKSFENNGTGSTFSSITVDVVRKHLIPLPPLSEQKRIVNVIDAVFAQIDIIDELQKRYSNDLEILKSKIIDAGIRGKLTKQLSEDGTAEELYKQIQEEKARLIKEGKIKKTKELSEITEEEVPFDIPDNWKWVYMGDIFQHNTGKALNSSDIEGDFHEYITTSNLYWDRFELNNLKQMRFKSNEIEKCTVTKGDLLICEGGDIGRSAIWKYDFDMRIQNHIHKLRGVIPKEICVEYFYYVMWLYKQNGWINGRGIGLQGFSSKRLHSLVVPLPPVAEQRRIADRISELMNLFN